MASIDPAELARRLDSIVAKAGPAAPLLLFLASFLEYVFPPVPGDLVAVLGAWYATHGGLSWTVLFVSLSFGAVAGTSFDWRLGRWLGARLDDRVAVGRLDRDRLERFERAYRRWGGLLLIVNRFLPGVRAFFFLAAGAAGIPLWKVLLYGGISAALWNVLLLGAGALLARNEMELVALFARYDTVAWIVVLAACAIAILVWRRRRARRTRA
ncbi:MAG: DedA family protein [Deltaproteobacteria bacterium]|nr:MAG: DedA family protein [Deltaproteobacteria bacterium]